MSALGLRDIQVRYGAIPVINAVDLQNVDNGSQAMTIDLDPTASSSLALKTLVEAVHGNSPLSTWYPVRRRFSTNPRSRDSAHTVSARAVEAAKGAPADRTAGT
ncbi:MAG: hypothetical protein ACR2LF_09710 [Jatrophihabitantaceae bacterium]